MRAMCENAGADGRLPVPYAPSYWVVEGRFLAGSYPEGPDEAGTRATMDAMLAAGIRRFVRLMEKTELGEGGKPDYAPILADAARALGVDARVIERPVRDFGVPTRVRMAATLDAIDGAISAGLPVYLHCWGGLGRTGTAVGCWLARHGLASGDAVFDAIARLRARLPSAAVASPENEEQRALVRSWRFGE